MVRSSIRQPVPRLVLAAAAFLSLCVPTAASSDALFGSAITTAVGTSPSSVAIGDLNLDGKPDVVTATTSANSITVLLGNGDGTLGSRIDYAAGRTPYMIAIGDLNNDGLPDIVVPSESDNSVSVRLGHGDGSFGPRNAFLTMTQPVSVAIGDLDGDGNMDLTVVDYGPYYISVLPGYGNGTFGPRRDFPAANAPNSMAMADLNGDGKLDLAVANYGNSVSVFPGIGDGSFGGHTEQASGDVPVDVAVGDVTGDGRPDIVVPNSGYGMISGDERISVFRNTGSGFAASEFHDTMWFPGSIAIGDLDGDHYPDVAVGGTTAPQFAVLINNRSGGFPTSTDYALGTYVSDLAIADMNLDGKLDVVTTNGNPAGVVAVFLNIGTPVVGVSDAPSAAFGMVSPRPNPALARHLTVEFSLVSTAPARLELLDLAGRRVADREVGALGSSRHTVSFGSVSPGVYFVRLTQGERSIESRVVALD